MHIDSRGTPWRRPNLGFALAIALAFGVIHCGGGSPASPDVAGPTTLPPQVLWVQQHAKPFLTTDPAAADSDIAFLAETMGSATVVGLGEATHGSSEFQQMKDRVFRSLVTRKGFTVFGLEAQMGFCRAIDRYVLKGEGDPVAAIRGQGFWVWSTEEMLALVRWMRSYNADPAHAKKLRFFGFDVQDGGQEIDEVVAFLQQVDPQVAPQVQAWLLPFRPYTWTGGKDYRGISPQIRAQIRGDLQRALEWLISHEAAYAARSSAEEAAFATQMARVVLLAEAREAADPDGIEYYNLRDQGMADNVQWYVEHLDREAKMVLSAHNGHINRWDGDDNWVAMGELLAEHFGSRYFTMGFAFNEGGLTAVAYDAGGTYLGILANTALPAGTGSVEDAFVKAGMERAFLDLRTPDWTQPGAAWFQEPHPFRDVGAVWRSTPGWCVHAQVIGKRFDGLAWIRNVKATTLLH